MTDQPPAGSNVEKTLDFADLPVTPLPESVLRYREELQKSLQKRLADPGNNAMAGDAMSATMRRDISDPALTRRPPNAALTAGALCSALISSGAAAATAHRARHRPPAPL